MKLSWRLTRPMLSAAVALGALTGLTVAASPAHAGTVPHVTAVGGPAGAGALARPALASAAHASARALARLTLANTSDLTSDGYRWQVSGSWYPWGRSDVQLRVFDITSWATIAAGPVEYQSGLRTTSCTIACVLGGAFLWAEGAAYYVPPSGILGGYWVPLHPLQCGHSYAAYTQDPIDGEVGSNTLTEPACPPPPPR
jgi:hypothetical protein